MIARLGLLICLLLIACQSDAPTPPTFISPTSPSTLSPLQSVARSTVTTGFSFPTSTATPLPTRTPQPSTATPIPSRTPRPTKTPQPNPLIIGYSVENRPIEAYHFGSGEHALLFVGGIHGGSEWNTVLLAYQLIDTLMESAESIPPNKRVYIIPVMNPDGLLAGAGVEGRFAVADIVMGSEFGRLNANNVDLNRNWDCEWSAEARWGNRSVSGGTAPFSEPEVQAVRDLILANNIRFVLFWHSIADGIYASGCPNEYAPAIELAQIYGQASGYPIHPRFDAYPITGDASDWCQ